MVPASPTGGRRMVPASPTGGRRMVPASPRLGLDRPEAFRGLLG